MQLRVRAAAAADLEDLCRSTHGNALESEGLSLDEATVRRGVAALVADPAKGMAYVASDGEGGPVVGSLYVTREWSDWHAQWYWWLQSVYVVPARRGTGVYSALYRHVLAEARRRGDVRAVRLYVERHNADALRAYRGHGMRQTEYRVYEQPLP